MAVKHTLRLGIAGLVVFASSAFAQYSLNLTGVGDGATADGVYVSPYQGTISQNGQQIYSGYMICDDFTDEAYLNTPWNAVATNASAVNSNDQFFDGGSGPNTGYATGYSAQQDYNAVAWLANQLLLSSNLTNSTNQTDISFAIWDIMDGASTNPDGGTTGWVTQAFNEVVNDHYVGTDVTVYTPQPNHQSQEFLVVSAPEASTPVLLAVDLFGFIALVALLRKRVSQSI